MNLKWKLTFIIMLTGCLLAPTQLLAKSAKEKKPRFPMGCFPVGYKFKYHTLTVTPTAKYHPQTIFLVHNLAGFPVHIRQIHTGDKPYVIHINTTIKPRFWSVLATDEKKLKFICTVNKKGIKLEQIIDCGKVLELCEFPNTRFGDNHRGNYWIHQRSTGNSAKRATKYHGVLLIDPKKTKRDKMQGSET